MPTRFASVPDKSAIVDRRALADALGRRPDAAASILKQALAEGRAEIARRLEAKPYAGQRDRRRLRLPHRPDRPPGL